MKPPPTGHAAKTEAELRRECPRFRCGFGQRPSERQAGPRQVRPEVGDGGMPAICGPTRPRYVSNSAANRYSLGASSLWPTTIQTPCPRHRRPPGSGDDRGPRCTTRKIAVTTDVTWEIPEPVSVCDIDLDENTTTTLRRQPRARRGQVPELAPARRSCLAGCAAPGGPPGTGSAPPPKRHSTRLLPDQNWRTNRHQRHQFPNFVIGDRDAAVGPVLLPVAYLIGGDPVGKTVNHDLTPGVVA